MSVTTKCGPAPKRSCLTHVALALIMPALLQASAQPIQVPYQQSRKFNAILVVVAVNGKPAVLIVDTGSDRTIISPHLLAKEPVQDTFQVLFPYSHHNAPATW